MKVLDEGHRNARKNHHCDSCHRRIKAGQNYYFQSNVMDGEMGTFKAHNDCHAAMRILPAFPMGGSIWTNVDEMDDEDMEIVKKADPDLYKRLFGS